MRRGLAVLAVALSLSGCAKLARGYCMDTYCANEPPGCAKYIDDAIIICTEEREKQYWNVLVWLGDFSLGLVNLGAEAL